MLKLDGDGGNEEAGNDGTEEEEPANDKANTHTQMWASHLLVGDNTLVSYPN